jgi:hypothetical protein
LIEGDKNMSKTNNALATSLTLKFLEKKVDKVEGKVLSTNDFSTAEKTKLAGLSNEAVLYEMPVATDTVLGGVKITGGGLSIGVDGVLTLTLATELADGAMSKEDKAAIIDYETRIAALEAAVEALTPPVEG